MKKLLSYLMAIGFVLTCVVVPTYATDTQPEPIAEKSFELSNEDIYIGPYGSVDLEVLNPVGLDVTQVKWESENPAIATVDENGLVEAVSIGDVKIIATIDGVQKECLVRVSKIIHLSLVGVIDGVIIEETRYTSPALLAGQAGFTDEFIRLHKEEVDEMTKEESGDRYEFAGMFLDVEGTKPIDSNTRFTEDATVYLVWKEKVVITPEETKPTEPEKTVVPVKTNQGEKKPVDTADKQSIMVYALLTTMTAGVFVSLKMKKASGE